MLCDWNIPVYLHFKFCSGLSVRIQSNVNGANIFGTMDICSRHVRGLIIAPGQEINSDNLGT